MPISVTNIEKLQLCSIQLLLFFLMFLICQISLGFFKTGYMIVNMETQFGCKKWHHQHSTQSKMNFDTVLRMKICIGEAYQYYQRQDMPTMKGILSCNFLCRAHIGEIMSTFQRTEFETHPSIKSVTDQTLFQLFSIYIYTL